MSELPPRDEAAPLTGVAEHPAPVRGGVEAADVEPDEDDDEG